SAAGVLSGTPTTAGTSTVTITGTDANGCPASIVYTLVIAPVAVCPVITLSPVVLPSGMIALAYSQPITASGGTAPYVFTVTLGSLPAGLTLTPGGLLSGTPTTVGSSNVSIRGTDANGCFATVAYVIVIAPAVVCPVLTLSPSTLPNAAVGAAYSQQLTAAGGVAPYVYTLTSGTLPAGVTLTPTGLLSGTPTTAGTSTVTIRATDANGCFVSIVLTILTVTTVPTMPDVFLGLLALTLLVAGYLRVRASV
nr:putative Ig domain-containing protein [Acidobacteriota bacterium]